MNTKNTNSINKKNEFAFCAIMFFAPLIKNNLKTNWSLSNEDKSFINWFIKLWYLNILLLTISIIFRVIQVRTNNIIIQKINMWFLILLAISLCIWTLLVALNKNINPNQSEEINNENNLDKLLYFIPLYNIYIWYEHHQFEWDNSLIKSSILLRTLFTMSSIFIPNIYVNICILVLILFKIIYSVSWLTFWTKRNEQINNFFQKNPEEIRWYISWTIKSLFNKNWLKNNIDEQKNIFSFIFKIDNKQIIFEYILLCLVCALWIYVWITHELYFIVLWDVMIILRYWIMALKWKHLPHLPIFKWITNIFFKSKIAKNE